MYQGVIYALLAAALFGASGVAIAPGMGMAQRCDRLWRHLWPHPVNVGFGDHGRIDGIIASESRIRAHAGLAWFVFRENFDWRIACGMAAIVGGSVVLSIGPGGFGGVSRGARTSIIGIRMDETRPGLAILGGPV